MNPLVLKLIPYIGAALVGFVGGVAATSNHYRTIVAEKDTELAQERLTWSQAVQKGQADNLAELTRSDILKTKLGVEHEQANKALNVLLGSPAVSVRLPTTCVSATSSDTAPAPSGSAVSTAPAERTGDPHQEALDGVKLEMDADALEWRNALEACRVMQGFINGQGQ